MSITFKSNSRLGRRRSQRVALSMPVVISQPETNNMGPIEKTRTLSVSRHGGLVTMRVTVNCGQNLMVTNPFSRMSQPCRVVYVSPEKQEERQVGFEFLEPAAFNFWNITFPNPTAA